MSTRTLHDYRPRRAIYRTIRDRRDLHARANESQATTAFVMGGVVTLFLLALCLGWLL